jgi:signal transduction histidine kinase
LTRQLQAFSEPRRFRAEPIDVNQVLRRIRDTLARLMPEYVTFVCAPAPEPAVIHVDPIELEQAIVHVVRNARDAIRPPGGTVTVDVSYVSNPAPDIRGNFVGLRVVDTGIGMDWETQARMFEPFFTTKPQDEGTGLGLSVTYGIVRQCGGAFDVQSALNRGTTVTMYFPAT